VIKKLARVLAAKPVKHIADTNRRPSAILIPLYNQEGKYHIIFIQRTGNVTVHKHQISFPGGRYEAKDKNLQATALREAEEEIGIKQEDVRIIGELDDFATAGSHYVISPFVGIIPYPYNFKIDRFEAQEIIDVEIDDLMDMTCRSEGTTVVDGDTIPAYFYHHGNRVIWGATARILKQLLDIICSPDSPENP
jgi:8-oxo-dGTP pyrophosphatase MutT (NUDIX family)